MQLALFLQALFLQARLLRALFELVLFLQRLLCRVGESLCCEPQISAQTSGLGPCPHSSPSLRADPSRSHSRRNRLRHRRMLFHEGRQEAQDLLLRLTPVPVLLQPQQPQHRHHHLHRRGCRHPQRGCRPRRNRHLRSRISKPLEPPGPVHRWRLLRPVLFRPVVRQRLRVPDRATKNRSLQTVRRRHLC